MASPGHGPDTRGPTTLAVGLGRAEPGGAVQKSAFEVASDAFNTFKRLLTQHEVVSEFLQENHAKFFKMYEELLQSKNYATQRQVPPPPSSPHHIHVRSLRLSSYVRTPAQHLARPACVGLYCGCVGLYWPVLACISVVSSCASGGVRAEPGHVIAEARGVGGTLLASGLNKAGRCERTASPQSPRRLDMLASVHAWALAVSCAVAAMAARPAPAQLTAF